MLTVIALMVLGLATYWILLSKLATSLQLERPDVYAKVGRPGSGDYLAAGLTVGDGYISKLEAIAAELGNAPNTLKLMKAVRWAWATTFFLAIGGIFVLFAHAT